VARNNLKSTQCQHFKQMYFTPIQLISQHIESISHSRQHVLYM